MCRQSLLLLDTHLQCTVKVRIGVNPAEKRGSGGSELRSYRRMQLASCLACCNHNRFCKALSPPHLGRSYYSCGLWEGQAEEARSVTEEREETGNRNKKKYWGSEVSCRAQVDQDEKTGCSWGQTALFVLTLFSEQPCCPSLCNLHRENSFTSVTPGAFAKRFIWRGNTPWQGCRARSKVG